MTRFPCKTGRQGLLDALCCRLPWYSFWKRNHGYGLVSRDDLPRPAKATSTAHAKAKSFACGPDSTLMTLLAKDVKGQTMRIFGKPPIFRYKAISTSPTHFESKMCLFWFICVGCKHENRCLATFICLSRGSPASRRILVRTAHLDLFQLTFNTTSLYV
jgi:hypothetical protein